MTKRNYLKIILIILGWLIIIITALTIYYVNKENRIDFLKEVQYIANKRISNIEIIFDESTTIPFSSLELRTFLNEVQKADTSTPSSHSGPVAEGCLQITLTSGDVLYYYAAVHKYEPENLYLKRDNSIKIRENLHQGTGPSGVICIPFLGNWYKEKVKDSPFLRAHPSDYNTKVIFF